MSARFSTLVCRIDTESRPETNGPLAAFSWWQSSIIDIGYAQAYNGRCDEASGQFRLSNGFGFSLGLQQSQVVRLCRLLSSKISGETIFLAESARVIM